MDYYPPVYARNTGARPRLPSAVLLAVGGHTISLDSGIVTYDFHVHKWIKVNNDMEARYHHGTVFYNVCIYLVSLVGKIRGTRVSRVCASLTWARARGRMLHP